MEQLQLLFFSLILTTLLAPILLYTHNLAVFPTSSFTHEFLQHASSPGVANSLKQALPTVYLDKSSKYVWGPGKIAQSGKGFIFPVSREHKPRLLLVANDGSESQSKNHIIKQAVDGVSERDEGINLPESKLVEKEESVDEYEVGEANEKQEVSGEMPISVSENMVDQHSGRGFPSINSEEPLDGNIRRLQDQLIRARIFLGLGAIRRNPQFVKDLRVRVKDVQRTLGEASKDSQLPRNAYVKSKALEQALAKGKQIQHDCAAVIKKLRATLQSTEEQLRAHKKQTLFLTQLTAKTLPKSIHCLPLRLSTEYFSLNSTQQQFPHQEKLENPKLYHYALFSDNILAAAVVVNSTVFHATDPANHVFHIVTDRLNYEAMKMWFLANPPGTAAIQVQNIEELTWLKSSYSPVLKQLGSPSVIEYYFKTHHANSDANLKFRNPKYLSILNHLRFYLPEIFPKLKKVLFLDDDVVVQKDLTSLWSLNLKGKVNGAVETCREGFHRFDRYLNFSNPLIFKNFDPHACGWAYGMNVFDLDEWRKQNITEVYHTWQRMNQNRQLWKLGTLPPGLITFWNRTFPLDRSWHVLGLGYDPSINQKEIEQAAVIHYNGNMKPWLEVGIVKYRKYWAKFVDYNQVYLHDCNINP